LLIKESGLGLVHLDRGALPRVVEVHLL
jgi:hypothetical protein